MRFIKKYWIEILVFITISFVLIMCVAPSATWINTDSDGIHDTYAAKNLYLSHKTSMPLYLLIGHLFTKIPFGTDFWNLALFSALSTIIACLFIYLSIREHLKENKNARWYALIGVIIYGGSALVISQSTIVETYAFITMLGIGAYYFYLEKWWKRCALMLGLGLAVHPLAGITLLVLVISKRELRTWKPIIIMVSCLLLYLYFPLSVLINPEQPNMWGNRTLIDMIKDLYGTYQFLFGSLAIYDLPKRLLDTLGILVVSLGMGFIVIIWYLYKTRGWKNILLWLFVLPIIMFVAGLPPQTYVYCMPSIAIGAVIIGISFSKMRARWIAVTYMVAFLLLLNNSLTMDIGNTLDPELSATKYYEEELNKVSDGQILMPKWGWEWSAIFSYNKEYNRDIIPVCISSFTSDTYRELLTEIGVKFDDNESSNRIERENYIALSIIDMNDNVWVTRPTTPETYGCEVVPAQGNEIYVLGLPTEPAGQIHWKPSNPYKFITGAVEVEEWVYITQSNWNVMLFAGLGSIGLLLNWLIFILPQKRKVNGITVSETNSESNK